MNDTQVEELAPTTRFRRLQERLRELRAEQSRLQPPPGFLRLGGDVGEWVPDADQARELRRLEISIDKVTMALNDYCRLQGQPDWY